MTLATCSRRTNTPVLSENGCAVKMFATTGWLTIVQIVLGGTAASHTCRVWGAVFFGPRDFSGGGGTAGENDRPSPISHAYAPRCSLADAKYTLHLPEFLATFFWIRRRQICSRTKSKTAATCRRCDLISDVLPFGWPWYGEPNAVDFTRTTSNFPLDQFP